MIFVTLVGLGFRWVRLKGVELPSCRFLRGFCWDHIFTGAESYYGAIFMFKRVWGGILYTWYNNPATQFLGAWASRCSMSFDISTRSTVDDINPALSIVGNIP